jgi:CHAD domain-containing protein
MNKRAALSLTASEVALTALSQSSAVLTDADRRARQGEGDPVEVVHELRVAIRRVRADLRIFAKVFDPIWLEKIKLQLCDLARVVGEERDLDVIFVRLEQLVAALPESDQQHAETLLSQLKNDRGVAHERTLAALSDRGRGAPIEALAVVASRPPLAADANQVAIEDLVAATGRQWRRLRKSVRAAEALPTAEELHKVRVRAKTLRYSLETLAPVLDRSARRHAKELAALQSHLGEMQDAVVIERWLREFRETGRGDAFLIGELVGIERAREEWFRATWRERWRRASQKRLSSWAC